MRPWSPYRAWRIHRVTAVVACVLAVAGGIVLAIGKHWTGVVAALVLLAAQAASLILVRRSLSGSRTRQAGKRQGWNAPDLDRPYDHDQNH